MKQPVIFSPIFFKNFLPGLILSLKAFDCNTDIFNPFLIKTKTNTSFISILTLGFSFFFPWRKKVKLIFRRGKNFFLPKSVLSKIWMASVLDGVIKSLSKIIGLHSFKKSQNHTIRILGFRIWMLCRRCSLTCNLSH